MMKLLECDFEDLERKIGDKAGGKHQCPPNMNPAEKLCRYPSDSTYRGLSPAQSILFLRIRHLRNAEARPTESIYYSIEPHFESCR